MASLNRVGCGLTVATHVPAEHFPSRRGEVLTVRTPYGERVRNASALGRMTGERPCRPNAVTSTPAAVLRPGRREGRVAWTQAARTASHGGLAVAAGATVKAVQQMLDHASAAMTLDVYAGLFADDLDAVADRLDRAIAKLNADQMRTEGARAGQTRPCCPSRIPAHRPLARPNGFRAASGNRTPDLRITSGSSAQGRPTTSVVCRWALPSCPGLALAGDGWAA
jgi:hypothetical protein